MKTVMIYDQCGLDSLQFIVFEADLSHLDGIYINNCDQSPYLQDELSNLLYDTKDGRAIYEGLGEFPCAEVVKGAKVIVCGFLP
jgi:hypothetical protein